MKKHLLSLLVLLLTTLSTHAYDFQSGDLYYNITSDNTVEVTYQAWEMGYYGLTTATIPSTVTYNETTYSVTAIGEMAFWYSTSLTSVFISESVTSIGAGAFGGCSALTSITIPETVTSIGESAFYDVLNIVYNGDATGSPWGAKCVNGYIEGYLVYADNTKTTLMGCSTVATGEIILPNSVTSIGNSAFSRCSAITSIDIPNSVTSIGNSAFSNCSALTSITIPNSVKTIGTSAFYGCSALTSITIPESVTSIGDDAFQYCSKLTKTNYTGDIAGWCAIQFGSNSANPVYYSTKLYINDVLVTDLVIPQSVTNIGDFAFYNCKSLTSAIIPASVTGIGDYAFSGCTGLTSITIPETVTGIGNNAFYNVPNIVYNGSATGSPWGAKNVNAYAEGYFVFADNTKTTLLTCSMAAKGDITIPESVITIKDSAFIDCNGLTSIIIPESVTSIGNSAFNGCSKLTSITLPESITNFGEYLFNGCYALTSFTIPNSITTIEKGAFNNCSSLATITIGKSVASIGEEVFKGCSSLSSVIWNAKQCEATSWVTGSYKKQYFYGPFANVSSQLTSFTIGDEVYSIPNYLCYGMNKLTSITIPISVASIGEEVFDGCYSLSSVIWNAKQCDYYGYYGPFADIRSQITTFTFGNEVEQIPALICYKMQKLTALNIPKSVTSIGNNAFSSCYGLSSVTIPNSVTSIGSSAFYDVLNIVYSGEATGAPWGARSMNGYMDGYFVFADDTKTTLIACSSAATGSISIPESVTTISDEAFYDCSSLTSITIPESVTSIGDDAFKYCSSLTKTNYTGDIAGWCTIQFDNSYANPIYFSDNLYINDVLVTDLVIPNGVTNIGNYVFTGCKSLTSATLPNSLTNIGNSAFSGCSNLTSITIPESVTSIGNSAFSGCSNLTSIILPNSVTSIGNYAFEDCFSLTSITIPDSVTSIGNSAFSGCSSLTSITIPDSVTSIGYYAFEDCSSLTSITIPDSVTSIGNSAFSGCSSLTSVVWNAKQCEPTSWNNYSTYYYGPFSNISSQITSFIIGEEVESIPAYLCYGMNNLSSITIPTSVTSIGEEVFYGCSSLTSVIWNAKQCAATKWETGSSYNKQYYYGPFANIKSQITSFTIGKEVEEVPSYLCYGMGNLTSVTSLSCTPPSCGSNVFYNTLGEKTLIVPSSSLESYKSTYPWKNFTSFEKCLSVFVQSSDSTLGVAQIDQDVDCDSVAIISATATPGYQFTQWSDGNTDNPRTIKLTQDTTLTAEFIFLLSGKCGDDLYWAYSNKEVRITGTGAMYNYTDSTMPWTLLRDSILTVRVGNNATSIGEYAFANTPKLAELYIGTNVEDIGANAFAGCRRLYDIYCYPTYPPFAESNSFANYNVYVYVPCENQRDYTLDVVWGEFKFIECIGSEDVVVTDDEVVVAPSYEDVTITWPIVSGADTYSLVLTKEGDTFCTLVFNAQGQLVSIAFKPRRQNAPAEEGTTPATYAEQTANGFRFTVTGLDEGTDYAYTLTVRNASNSVLETYTGEFTTLSNTPTGISDSPDATETVSDKGAEKLLRDGQVLIIRNGETYNMMGQRL